MECEAWERFADREPHQPVRRKCLPQRNGSANGQFWVRPSLREIRRRYCYDGHRYRQFTECLQADRLRAWQTGPGAPPRQNPIRASGGRLRLLRAIHKAAPDLSQAADSTKGQWHKIVGTEKPAETPEPGYQWNYGADWSAEDGVVYGTWSQQQRPQPYPSWSWVEGEGWVPPVAQPNGDYYWDEEAQAWKEEVL